MELGVAGSIAVEQFSSSEAVDGSINKWLKDNPNVDVIDIKFSSSASHEDWGSDALIIYRKES
ncbi:hypothetical protein [Terribacillus sp. DMT04]|uniref:hypothetical protein n=1 Tax=Terribacillus sp. DMT04 TaxID=2850441 RepID=UPI001C2BC262|nr:hypothetical protein [Terribacillus sp. DMT04]QXE02793.1 hypothetical protein KS242_06330 [Terribacillus sp. DMT04]